MQQHLARLDAVAAGTGLRSGSGSWDTWSDFRVLTPTNERLDELGRSRVSAC
jgi:hypothetical protein